MSKAFYITIFLCILPLSAIGQKALDETIRTNVVLENDIVSLREDLSKVQKEINDLLLQIEQDSAVNKELVHKYDSLLITLSQDSMLVLSQCVDSLEMKHESLRQSLLSTHEKIATKRDELSSLTVTLRKMRVYAEIQKQQKFESNWLYLNQRFSQMSSDKLTDISRSTDEFKSLDGFPDYQRRIAFILESKALYDNAWEYISSGEASQNVKTFRTRLWSLFDMMKADSIDAARKLSGVQFNELDSLDIRLSRFNGGIEKLKGVVGDINNNKDVIRTRSGKSIKSGEECLTIIKKYIFPIEGSENDRISQRYFKMIPYLDKLLHDYWEELKTNPFDVPTKTETIIINLGVK